LDGNVGKKAHPIVLFDGVCNLCNRSVAHIVRHDPKGRFRLASLQSAVGRSLQQEYGFNPDAVNTLVLIERGKAYTKSDAALRIARRLKGPVRYWWAARFVPRFFRDTLYDWIGRNRYRWFGKRDECMAPGPGVRERFLDADETPRSDVLR
jgi:predicted DCC family thiol-disulfide oxidoreductase YuxK